VLRCVKEPTLTHQFLGFVGRPLVVVLVVWHAAVDDTARPPGASPGVPAA
jgi:hypothetical protein